MALRDTYSLAIRTVRGNKLRTSITVAIIAFGIMALVGINTAIEAVKQKFTESFSSMGANGFTVRYREPRNMFGGERADVKKKKKGERKIRRIPIAVAPGSAPPAAAPTGRSCAPLGAGQAGRVAAFGGTL